MLVSERNKTTTTTNSQVKVPTKIQSKWNFNTHPERTQIIVCNSSTHQLNEKEKKARTAFHVGYILRATHNILPNKWTNMANTECFSAFAWIFSCTYILPSRLSRCIVGAHFPRMCVSIYSTTLLRIQITGERKYTCPCELRRIWCVCAQHEWTTSVPVTKMGASSVERRE